MAGSLRVPEATASGVPGLGSIVECAEWMVSPSLIVCMAVAGEEDCGVSLPQPHHDHDHRQPHRTCKSEGQLQPSYSSSASPDKISAYILGYFLCLCLHTYIHTYYIPTYLHTYIPTYVHTYIRTYSVVLCHGGKQETVVVDVAFMGAG